MARPFAVRFYHSKAWKSTRDAYAASKCFLCERCLDRGVYSKGEIVHHKRHLTPENINDPRVTLNFDNLELLCRDCHADEHYQGGKPKRYAFDKDGNIVRR